MRNCRRCGMSDLDMSALLRHTFERHSQAHSVTPLACPFCKAMKRDVFGLVTHATSGPHEAMRDEFRVGWLKLRDHLQGFADHTALTDLCKEGIEIFQSFGWDVDRRLQTPQAEPAPAPHQLGGSPPALCPLNSS